MQKPWYILEDQEAEFIYDPKDGSPMPEMYLTFKISEEEVHSVPACGFLAFLVTESEDLYDNHNFDHLDKEETDRVLTSFALAYFTRQLKLEEMSKEQKDEAFQKWLLETPNKNNS